MLLNMNPLLQKETAFFYFSILTIVVFTYTRSMLIIKIYKIFLVSVLSKFSIMTLVHIPRKAISQVFQVHFLTFCHMLL